MDEDLVSSLDSFQCSKVLSYFTKPINPVAINWLVFMLMYLNGRNRGPI